MDIKNVVGQAQEFDYPDYSGVDYVWAKGFRLDLESLCRYIDPDLECTRESLVQNSEASLDLTLTMKISKSGEFICRLSIPIEAHSPRNSPSRLSGRMYVPHKPDMRVLERGLRQALARFGDIEERRSDAVSAMRVLCEGVEITTGI